MMKILTVFCLMASICAANDFEEYAYTEPAPPSPYARFAKTGPALVNGRRITVTYYRAWAECPVEFLNEEIPQEALTYFYGKRLDEAGTVIPHDLLILKDFILGKPIYSKDGTKCIITLAARNGIMYRTMYVTEQDMAVWDQYLTGYDRPSTTWLDEDQREALLETEDYKREEKP
jgi:hypothetical protein